MVKKWDNVLLGLLCGIVVPVLIMLAYYKISYTDVSISYFLDRMSSNHLEAKLISVSTVGNLGAFFLFLYFNLDMTAKGVVGSMFIYGAIIMYYKY